MLCVQRFISLNSRFKSKTLFYINIKRIQRKESQDRPWSFEITAPQGHILTGNFLSLGALFSVFMKKLLTKMSCIAAYPDCSVASSLFSCQGQGSSECLQGLNKLLNSIFICCYTQEIHLLCPQEYQCPTHRSSAPGSGENLNVPFQVPIPFWLGLFLGFFLSSQPT